MRFGLQFKLGKIAQAIAPPVLNLLFDGTNQADLATTITYPVGTKFHLIDTFKLNATPTTNYYIRGSGSAGSNFIRITGSSENILFNIGGIAHTATDVIEYGVIHKVEAIFDGTNIKYYLDDTLLTTLGAPTIDVIHTTIGGNGVGLFNNFRDGVIYSSSDENLDTSSKVSWDINCNCTTRQKSNELPADTSKDLILSGVEEDNWINDIGSYLSGSIYSGNKDASASWQTEALAAGVNTIKIVAGTEDVNIGNGSTELLASSTSYTVAANTTRVSAVTAGYAGWQGTVSTFHLEQSVSI